MDKVASPRQFVAEAQAILDYARTARPSREVMASSLVALANRVLGRRVFASRTPLYGYDSENRAYLVEDYPYGFRERTQIRYWIEMKSGKGFRFVSQTLNPKTQRWNKPKASTYALLAGVMYLDEKKHVQWDGLSEYSRANDVLEFVQRYPRADMSVLKRFAQAKIKFLFDMIEGKRFFTINGERAKQTEEDLGRLNDEVEQWHEASTYMH